MRKKEKVSEANSAINERPDEWRYLSLVTDDSIEEILNNYTFSQLMQLRRKLLFFSGL